MANKMQKISVNTLDECLKDILNTGYAEIEWRGQKLMIQRRLSLAEMEHFINGVVQSCFTDDAAYLPEAMNIALKCSVILYFTNIRLPDSDEKRYLYADTIFHDLRETIFTNIDYRQYEDMIDAIQKKIDYLTDVRAEAVMKQLEALGAAAETFSHNISSVTEGISADDLKNVIQAIGNGRVDEGKLMEAYLERGNVQPDEEKK